MLNPETVSKPAAQVRAARTDDVSDGRVCRAGLQGGSGGPCPSLGQLQEQGAGAEGRRGSAPHAAPADSSEGSAFSKQWSYYISASAVILGLKALWVRNLPL